MPELHVITGSNGAGKSSVGFDFLPQHIRDVCTIFDGDKLALNKTKELFATKVHSYKEAKNLANEWILEYFDGQVNEAIISRANFVYEGHFRETSSWNVLERFKKSGYAIHMLFFGLVNPERSEMRVLERALSGGHNVSRAEIEWNYYGNLSQLDRNFGLLNVLRILDTSEPIPKAHFEMSDGEVKFCTPFYELPDWFTNHLINITRFAYPGI